MPLIQSIFDNPADVVAAVNKLKARGFTDLETYSPAPFEEIDEAVDPKPSAVRLFTLIGGLAGVFTGFFIQIWMSLDWPIKIAGKPFASIPPYVIIGFELTILFGGLLTFIGLLALGGLRPRLEMDAGYSARFSGEEFGVVVDTKERDVAEVDGLLRANHAKEVSIVQH